MQESDEVTKMDQVERMMQRPKLYYNIDGVGELGMGFMLLCFALLQWLQINSPAGAIWHRVYVLFLWIGVMGVVIHYGSEAIKKHITYPRTGFVEYSKRYTVWHPAVIAFCTSALVAMGIAFVARSHWEIGRSHWVLTTPAGLIGLVVVVAYGYGIARSVRWKWAVAGVMAICSIAIALLPEGAIGSMTGSTSDFGAISSASIGAWLLIIMLYGAILLISGGISFLLYMRRTQPVAEMAE